MSRLATLFIFLTLLTDPAKIGKINRAKDEAKKAYLAGNYKTAAQHYRYLTDSLGVQEDEVLLNLAHSHFQLNDTAQARRIYERLTASRKPQIKSTALQQLGVLSNKLGKSEEALSYFKEALKAYAANNEARYNYELLKKKLDEQKKREQPDQQQKKDQQQNENQQKEKQEQNKNKNEQQQKDRQNSDQKKTNEQKKEEQQSKDQQLKDKQQKDEMKEPSAASEKQEQQKINSETAKMLLEALKNQELQYLQQNKRKPSKPKDKGKPDW